MKFKQNTYPYEYSIRDDETIECIFLYDTKNEKKDIEEFLLKLIKDSELTIGDGCDGEIIIKRNRIIVINHWITSVGFDWLTGDLNRERLVFPNGEREADPSDL